MNNQHRIIDAGKGGCCAGGGVVKRCLRSWLFVFLLLFPLPLPFHSEKVEGIEEVKQVLLKDHSGGGLESQLLASRGHPPFFILISSEAAPLPPTFFHHTLLPALSTFSE